MIQLDLEKKILLFNCSHRNVCTLYTMYVVSPAEFACILFQYIPEYIIWFLYVRATLFV